MQIIRWGIVGTGSMASWFAQALKRCEGSELAAVGSRAEAQAAAFARAHGAARSYGSYEAVACDRHVDIVYIATPNTFHRAHCLLALRHGKHVLCEKPFTLDATEAREVIDAARSRGLFCMEAMWMRFVPLMLELTSRVRAGAIGELQRLDATLGLPIAFDPAHRVFAPDLGGGALLDLGVYPLSLAVQLFGQPLSVRSLSTRSTTGVDEQTSVLLQFAGGRQATLASSVAARLGNHATLVGTRGRIQVHAPLYCPVSASVHRSAAGSDTTLLTRRPLGRGYAHEILAVMQCLRSGVTESPVMPLDETLLVIQTIERIRAQWSTSD